MQLPPLYNNLEEETEFRELEKYLQENTMSLEAIYHCRASGDDEFHEILELLEDEGVIEDLLIEGFANSTFTFSFETPRFTVLNMEIFYNKRTLASKKFAFGADWEIWYKGDIQCVQIRVKNMDGLRTLVEKFKPEKVENEIDLEAESEGDDDEGDENYHPELNYDEFFV